MRKTIYVFCFLLINFTVNAQLKKDRSFFKLGIRAVEIHTDNIPIKDNFHLKPVVDVGFGMNYNLSEKVRFQPEIHYNPRGFKAKYNFTDSTYLSQSLELHYLDLCPSFSYTFGGHQSFQTRVIVWGGPYLGVGIVGRNVVSGVTLNANGTKADENFSYVNKKFGDGLNRIDYGFNVGFGLQYEKFAQIGFSYGMGLNNIADNTSFTTYNRSVGIYVVVLFDDMF